jgi:acetyl-CoA carboxylase biotin carboxyl carrier protein
MDLNLIKKLIKLVNTSEITDLEVEEGGLRVKIGKKNESTHVISQPQFMPHSQQVSPVTEPEAEEIEKPVETSNNLHEVRSPIVGTFYRAPAPDADPYVQVGDMINRGQVLCIVEAMKLMNEIESDIEGKIAKILVENGKPVEYNQPLFLIHLS